MTPCVSVRKSLLRRRVSAVGIFSAVLLGLLLLFHEPLAGLGGRWQHTLPEFAESKPTIRADWQSANIGQKNVATIQLQQQLLSANDRSRRALELFTALLEDASKRLEKSTDYSASFVIQERLEDQELQELQNIELKVRHAPFSIYMKSLDGGNRGREVLYVADQLDDCILLRLGGIQGRLLGSLKLDPTGSLAMKESRYPVTDMGLLNLALKIIALRHQDLARDKGFHWQLLPNQTCFGRDCLCLLVEYDSPEFSAMIRKSLTYIDKELSLPICVKNFTWPDADSRLEGEQLDNSTLIEFYGYQAMQFNIGLKENDFDPTNEEYAFSR